MSVPQLPVLYESNAHAHARSSTRLPVIEPILTGVDVFAANGISTDASFRGPRRSFFFHSDFNRCAVSKKRGGKKGEWTSRKTYAKTGRNGQEISVFDFPRWRGTRRWKMAVKNGGHCSLSLCPSLSFNSWHNDCFRLLHSDALASTFSALYGKLLVVMGIAFPMAEVISTYIPPSFYEGFYLYLYFGSMIFLVYMYATLLRDGKPKSSKSRPIFIIFIFIFFAR